GAASRFLAKGARACCGVLALRGHFAFLCAVSPGCPRATTGTYYLAGPSSQLNLPDLFPGQISDRPTFLSEGGGAACLSSFLQFIAFPKTRAILNARC
ncbi:unnamed protein product, partial [Amoebophrya sp. A120]